ncbi:serine/threonine protein kinase [Desulfurivibrio dismutans]|uniref:serine/threonine protein kinase n=1 Tax=Desulfurivibrio dismutans TaxID=1398908 RepID=UPI0023DB08CD|nr:serine/threonine protein kinase [Desulfurivibrio alkaliphilus]MDF1614074.1 serine/threonine protein kinase [Desulfurivibrio alkaliphilus]
MVVSQAHSAFHCLTPDVVLDLVEKAMGIRCTNLCRPLASYINRVYELEAEDGDGLVVKFYRPGRWSRDALVDEHDFLLELADREIPVIAPLRLAEGSSLGEHQGTFFAVFPKCGGRSWDEFSNEQWLEIGRLLGRIHAVGAGRIPAGRIVMAPDHSTRQQTDYLLAGKFMPDDLAPQFAELTAELIAAISPLFAGIEMIRIHGDCHFSNLIYRPGVSFYLIDFDDMALGPPVQDFWMLLPGYREDSRPEIELFLEGYETFRDFDRRTLRLIEPLRAMRYIHYMAWCAYQVAEEGLSRVAPDFGTRDYWQRELRDLAEQLARIKAAPEPQGNWR